MIRNMQSKSIIKKTIIITSATVGLALIISVIFLLNLPAPDVKTLQKVAGSSLLVEGNALSSSTVKVYVDGAYKDSAKSSGEGGFNIEIKNDDEGEVNVTVKQSLFIFEGKESNSQKVFIDLTAPPTDNLVLPNIPDRVTEGTLSVKMNVGEGNTLLVNDTRIESSDGSIDGVYNLKSGDNKLDFALEDAVGNKSQIFLTKNVNYDTGTIDISTWSAGDLSLQYNDNPRKVHLWIGDWTGYNGQINQLPIVGNVGKDIKSVTVDGKSISWDADGKVYQRVDLYLNGGINKYKVVVTDIYGSSKTDYLSTTSESTSNRYQLEIR